MKQRITVLLIILIFFSTGSLVQSNDVVNDNESSSYNLNKPERKEWLRNTNNGMFIHFNVDAPLGIVISHSLVGASDVCVQRYFAELPQTFNPKKIDPDEIATLAKLAGMKYIMYNTKKYGNNKKVTS
jgi:alpha-L-fucosidase